VLDPPTLPLAPNDASPTALSTPPRPAIAPVRPDGMKEPGIFKGCVEIDGPLAPTTKRAILAYLGKPNAKAWVRVAGRVIVGRTTLGQAWAEALPAGSDRHPNAAELVRAIRLAVTRQLTGINGGRRRTH